MNDERYVLAKLIEVLAKEDRQCMKEKGYGTVWNLGDICTIIEELRAEAILGEDVRILNRHEEVE